MNYHAPFHENELYHVFNRANGNDLLFRNDDNFCFFLKKLRQYILPVAEIYAYALIPNHFHLLVQIKSYEDFQLPERPSKTSLTEKNSATLLVSDSFKNFQNSYAKSFNKVFNRKGSLFMSPIKRLIIENDEQLASTIFYIHKNPVHHGWCKRMGDWKWSSFNDFYSGPPTWFTKDYGINFFGNIHAFDKFHQQEIEVKTARVIE